MSRPKIDVNFKSGSFVPDSVTVAGGDREDPRRLAEIANRAAGEAALDRLAIHVFGHKLDTDTKEGLIQAGHSFWEQTYKHTDSDLEAAKRYQAFADAQPHPFSDIVLNAPDCFIYIHAARWADQAFPTLVMGEKYFAALLATAIPDDMLGEIKAPWKAFCIEIPDGQLYVFDPEEQERVRVTRILVQVVKHENGDDEWHWIAFSEKSQHLWRSGTPDQIVKPVQFSEKEHLRYKIHAGEGAFEEHVSLDERLYFLISRLVLNVCLAVTEHGNVKEIGSSHERWKKRQTRGEGRGETPEQRIFRVGRPIQIDCRPAVREYLEGTREGAKLKVHILVRGYWRSQPWGPKLAFRRRQWIEPYWKHPESENAPILVRPHVLGGDDENDES